MGAVLFNKPIKSWSKIIKRYLCNMEESNKNMRLMVNGTAFPAATVGIPQRSTRIYFIGFIAKDIFHPEEQWTFSYTNNTDWK